VVGIRGPTHGVGRNYFREFPDLKSRISRSSRRADPYRVQLAKISAPRRLVAQLVPGPDGHLLNAAKTGAAVEAAWHRETLYSGERDAISALRLGRRVRNKRSRGRTPRPSAWPTPTAQGERVCRRPDSLLRMPVSGSACNVSVKGSSSLSRKDGPTGIRWARPRCAPGERRRAHRDRPLI
jgi:hypothetical protein